MKAHKNMNERQLYTLGLRLTKRKKYNTTTFERYSRIQNP